jgi:ketosteroid isomerase-like protein
VGTFARTPEECDRRFAECVRSRHLDDLVGLYEPAACFVRRDGTVVTGHSEIRRALARLTIVPTVVDIRIVKVIETDCVAVLYSDWQSRATAADGRVAETSGRALEIVRRQPDGRWLFAIDDPFGRDRPTTRPLH